MENSRSKNISVVIYDHKRPRFFKINKMTLNLIFYGLPFVTFICVLLLIFGLLYFKQLKTLTVRKEPAIIKELKLKNKIINNAFEMAIKEQKMFERKLNNSSSSTPGISVLSLFKTPFGQIDKSGTPLFSIEDIRLSPKNSTSKVNLTFNIVNQSHDQEKLAGYIYVIMKEKNRFSIYPQNRIDSDDMLLGYSQGESFATSRFRPVSAEFSLHKETLNTSKILFKILIFSRTGDLLHKKIYSSKTVI